MNGEKRDPPTINQTISPEMALVYWITGLQTEHLYGLPSIRVKNYHGDEEYTELDLYQDDPTNLIDGSWTDPILVTEAAWSAKWQ